jgi:signal transduction histidine kinase
VSLPAFRTLPQPEALLAIVLTAACVGELLLRNGASPTDASAAGLLACAGGAIALRRRAPLAAPLLCVVLTLTAVILASAEDIVSPQFVVLLPPYAIGSSLGRRRAFAGLAACLGAVCVFSAITGTTAGSWAFAFGMTIGSFLVGRAVQSQRLLVTELAAVAVSMAASREESSRLAVQEVRVRISDDVNTLVAQSIASMVIASEAALRILPLDLAEADAAMLAIEETGREALSEVRRMLGVLRHDPRTPTPDGVCATGARVA